MKLALKVFTSFFAEAMRTRGKTLNLPYAEGTADYIEIIVKWWSIVNVKTPTKGRRSKDGFQEPITSMDGVQVCFLSTFVEWLDTWRNLGTSTELLTSDTHTGLRLTSYALIELARYSLEELGF